MIKLDLSAPVINLNGAMILNPEQKVVTPALMVASALAKSNSGDAVKFMDWARALYKDGVIYVDAADYKKLYDMFKDNQNFEAIYRDAFIREMEKSKSLHDNPPKLEAVKTPETPEIPATPAEEVTTPQ